MLNHLVLRIDKGYVYLCFVSIVSYFNFQILKYNTVPVR